MMKTVIFISKTGHTIVEHTQSDDAMIRLRASALGWQIVSIEEAA